MGGVRVGVAGLGLIGSSVGQGLTPGFASRVVGYDPSERARAAAACCVDATVSSLEGLSGCGLVVLAAPPSQIPGLLSELAAIVSDGCALTDVASVKSEIAAGVPNSLRTRFVPGHPMAGHESSGGSSARGDLFHGATWVLCPPGDVDSDAMDRVLGMVRHLRALPLLLGPEEHDLHAAVLSHLPHVFAAALLVQSESLPEPGIAAGSWRDLTRVGGSNPELWADILVANRAAMLGALETSGSLLDSFRAAVEAEDKQALVALFQRAKAAKGR
ncbi:MAG: prephenate dehydrogenase/arogenate dehydrogenase family protein [Armatimonadetes bacterium]|nr:prephenate dehydrogenase/arogenate dehydrogenase family protein [Armatimonadota bacterium]